MHIQIYFLSVYFLLYVQGISRIQTFQNYLLFICLQRFMFLNNRSGTERIPSAFKWMGNLEAIH